MAHKPNGNGNGKKKKPVWPKYGVMKRNPAVPAGWLHGATEESFGVTHISNDPAAADAEAVKIDPTGVDATAFSFVTRKPRKPKPKK